MRIRAAVSRSLAPASPPLLPSSAGGMAPPFVRDTWAGLPSATRSRGLAPARRAAGCPLAPGAT
eukprot:7165452-Pyramimonas_sp.AAC.1